MSAPSAMPTWIELPSPMVGGGDLSRAWRPLMRHSKLRPASNSLCAIQRGPNTIQQVALIERLGQIADDPSLKGAGTNIIARIRRYQYGGNFLAQSRQIAVQIKARHLGHVEVYNQAAGAAQFR